jgi:hypothetical protein
MSLSPLKVFQRFKELFARRSPSIAAATRKAENRQAAAAYEPPVTKVIGPGGKVYTRDYDVLAQDKDEDGWCHKVSTLSPDGLLIQGCWLGFAGVRTQARDTGKSGLEGLLFARSYPWVNGVGANGTIDALISNERISQTVATKPTNTFMAMVSTIGTTVFLVVRAFYPVVNIGYH